MNSTSEVGATGAAGGELQITQHLSIRQWHTSTLTADGLAFTQQLRNGVLGFCIADQATTLLAFDETQQREIGFHLMGSCF